MDAATVGLIGGAIGVGGTLVGTVFTQARSDSRDRVRLASEERREDRRHDIELQRAREARLFDHRRTALLDVIAKYHHFSELAWEVENGATAQAPGDDALEPFWQVLSEVDLYCGPESARTARALYQAVSVELHGVGAGSFDSRQNAADQAFTDFLSAARGELGVPTQAGPPPTDGNQ